MTRLQASLSIRSVVLFAPMLAIIGCDTFAADKRQVIARNAEWTITAVGYLEASGRGFRANLVRFEAARRGLLYADGELYEAGPHDHSFVTRYESREWIVQTHSG